MRFVDDVNRVIGEAGGVVWHIGDAEVSITE